MAEYAEDVRMTRLVELSRSRELLVNLTLRDLRGRYKRSVLGWAWSLLNPLATMLIFSLVFRVVLKVPVPRGDPSGLSNFAFFLLSGLIFWNLFSSGVSGSMGALIANANLIKKVYFPREVLVAASVASAVVTALVEATVLVAALVLTGNFVVPWLPVVVVLMALEAVFVTGVALALSSLNVYLRDLEYGVGILLQLLFYATPVLYPVELVPERANLLGAEVPLRSLYGLNPMVRFVEAFRDCLYHGRAPSLAGVAVLVVVALVSLAVGLGVFGRLEPRLAEEL